MDESEKHKVGYVLSNDEKIKGLVKSALMRPTMA